MMRWRSKSLRYCLTTLLVLVATLVVLLGAAIGIGQFAVTRVPEYRVQLQNWVSARTGLVVEFRSISARLRLYGPELVFFDAVVRTPDHAQVLASARRGSIELDLWESLTAGRLIAGRFTLAAPQIGLIRNRAGRIQLVGQSSLPESNRPIELSALPIGQFRVRDAELSFRDQITGRGPWSLSGISFNLDRSSTVLRLQGAASLPSALGKSLEFSAEVDGELDQVEALVSRFELEGTELDLAGWADVLPDEWLVAETGQGSVRVTAALQGTRLVDLVAKVDLAGVAAVPPAWLTPLPKANPLIIPVARYAMVHSGGTQDNLPANAAGTTEMRSALPPDGAQAGAGTALTVAESAAPVGSAVPDTPGASPRVVERSAAATDQPADEAAPSLLLSYDRLAFDLHARRQTGGWDLAASDIELTRPGSPWHARKLGASWTRGADGQLDVSASADRLVLQNLWPLLVYLPESPQLARLRALAASGGVENLALSVQRAGSGQPLRYSVRADLADVSVQPVLAVPGFAGMTARIQGTDTGGQVIVDSSDLQFDLPRMFRWPLHAATLRGTFDWRRSTAGLEIDSQRLDVTSADGSATARIGLRLPADGSSPVIDLAGQARDLQASATAKYLPANRLSAGTLAWLDRAFVAGQVSNAEVMLKGPIRKFPFRHGEGEFLARGRADGVTFDYMPGWAPATRLTAAVEFRNQGMKASGAAGRVGGMEFSDASGDFPDFAAGEMTIHARAHGDLNHALRFLQSSPIGPVLGAQFNRLSGTGETQADVQLHLPLHQIEARRVAVNGRIENATVNSSDLRSPLSELSGSLQVNQDMLETAALQGNWRDGPVRIEVRPDTAQEAASGHAALVRVTGNTSAGELVKLLDLPASVQLSGAADWRLTTRLVAATNQPRAVGAGVRDATAGAHEFLIESDLQGLGIGLPYPLDKPAQQARPLRVELEYDGTDSLLSRASLGDARALLRMRHDAAGWTFDRGTFRADGLPASLPGHRGLRLEGSLDRLVLGDWLALGPGQRDTAEAGAASKAGVAGVLNAANLRVASLDVYGLHFRDVRGMLQSIGADWRVDVTGPDAAGTLIIPHDLSSPRPFVAQLARLALNKVADVAGDAATGERQTDSDTGADQRNDPRLWPSLRVAIEDLAVDAHSIGAVTLRTTRMLDGMKLDELTVTQEAVRGDASGQWVKSDNGERTDLQVKIVSTDVAKTLRALNYSPVMEAQHGEVDAQLSWPGGFAGDFVGRSSGTIKVSAERGQLLSVQPGAGRMLGLFSVAALPRRLVLDFRDLTDKGLSFDSVHGDFEMRDGNAYTNNLLLSGPAVEIGIAGRTGLGTRDYDQTAVVTGDLGVSLPVAGALAAGPAVGAAILLFSQVFKEPLKGITRGYYRITGPWDNPVVERVDAAEAKSNSSLSGAPDLQGSQAPGRPETAVSGSGRAPSRRVTP